MTVKTFILELSWEVYSNKCFTLIILWHSGFIQYYRMLVVISAMLVVNLSMPQNWRYCYIRLTTDGNNILLSELHDIVGSKSGNWFWKRFVIPLFKNHIVLKITSLPKIIVTESIRPSKNTLYRICIRDWIELPIIKMTKNWSLINSTSAILVRPPEVQCL